MLCKVDNIAFLLKLLQRVLDGCILSPANSINAAHLAKLPDGDGIKPEVLVCLLNLAAQVQYHFLLLQGQLESAFLYKVV